MSNHVKILLVEDEVITSMFIKSQLKNLGFSDVTTTTTGEKAIISVKDTPPHICLMDIRLAGEMDGIETVYIIRSFLDIPVIFITGYDDPLIRKRADKLKPLGFLIKPLVINELKSILNRHFSL